MYRKRNIYTRKELQQFHIADLKRDLECAIRDNLLDYAEEVKAELRSLENG